VALPRDLAKQTAELANGNSVRRSAEGENKERTNHVDVRLEAISDAGSTPAASILEYIFEGQGRPKPPENTK